MTEQTKVDITMTGRVVSAAMEKSIVVRVVRKVKHPLLKKYVTKSDKFHAHDPENQCHEGDLVTIRSVRPISKTKSWALKEINERAK